jgi:hypothetical protein
MPGVNELAYKLAADANERFICQDDGKMIWGSGAAIGDVILQRSAAATLGLTGSLTVSGTQTFTGLLTTTAGLTVGTTLTVTGVSNLTGLVTTTGGLTVGTTLTLSGGILTTSQAAVPTIPSPAAGWTTISFSSASTDTAGAITFTVSGTPAASAVAMPVVFNRTYAAAPKAVTLTMGDSSVNDPITMFYVPAASLATTGFTIATNATGAAQAGKVLYYHVDF